MTVIEHDHQERQLKYRRGVMTRYPIGEQVAAVAYRSMGYEACYDAGSYGTANIAPLSCRGYLACYEVGGNSGDPHDATIGLHSCNNYEACYQVGYDTDQTIGNFQCNGVQECSEE